MGTSEKVPGIIGLRTGCLDNREDIHPQAHIFVKEKQLWFTLPSEIPSFDEGYVFEDMWPKESFQRLMASFEK